MFYLGLSLTVSQLTGNREIMTEMWSMRTLIPSLHDTIDPIHPGHFWQIYFWFSSWVNNIFWVNIFTAAGQGSQMAADGVRVGGLLLPIDVVPGRATVIARRHTEVRANERVSQEPCTREGPRASSLPTTCPTRWQIKVPNTVANTNTRMRKGPRASPHLHGGGVASYDLSSVHLLESGFCQ